MLASESIQRRHGWETYRLVKSSDEFVRSELSLLDSLKLLQLLKGVVVLLFKIGRRGSLFYPVQLFLERLGFMLQSYNLCPASVALAMELLLLPSDHGAFINLECNKVHQNG